MNIANTILLVCGAIVLLFGIGAFLHPNLARWINIPGGPRLKAIIATIIGFIILIITLLYEIPME